MMEKLHRLFDKLMDAVFWQTLWQHFHWVDWVTVGFLVIGLIYGMRKGLMRELVELLEMVLILIVTFAYQPMVISFLTTYLSSMSERTLAPLAFILTAISVWFIVSVIDKYMQNWVHAKLAGFFKVVGGGAVGVFHFFLIWSFISQALILMPVRPVQHSYEAGGSVLGERVKSFAPAVYSTISNPGQFLPKRA